jgi:hypothetical protein
MELKTKRILKKAAFLGLKVIAGSLLVLILATIVVYFSFLITGSIWPAISIFAFIVSAFALWDVAKFKVEEELRKEDDLVRTLSRKH